MCFEKKSENTIWSNVCGHLTPFLCFLNIPYKILNLIPKEVGIPKVQIWGKNNNNK